MSSLSFAPAALTEADMWGVTPFDQIQCRLAFRSNRYDGNPFTPLPGTMANRARSIGQEATLDVAWQIGRHVTLVASVERRFRLRFTLAELQSLKNIGDMAALIQKKLSK